MALALDELAFGTDFFNSRFDLHILLMRKKNIGLVPCIYVKHICPSILHHSCKKSKRTKYTLLVSLYDPPLATVWVDQHLYFVAH